jgi:hypothetical protein
MTAAAPRNGFAKPRHRMSLWSAVKKLIARLLFDNFAEFDYPGS